MSERNRFMAKEFTPGFIFSEQYPLHRFIVEVSYSGRDVAITECYCEKEPAEKDNSKGFTVVFTTYKEAYEYGCKVQKELGFRGLI